MKKLFLFFAVIAALVGGAGFWYYQNNFYSKEAVKLEILGPESADLAEEVEYIVKYKNNGNVRVEEPELIFEYPENSIIENEKQREILGPEDLGESIYPGEEKIFRFKARLLGKEGDAKVARAWLTYIPKNLQAKYESQTSFTTIIDKVPLTFEFDFPSKIEAGKESKFRLNYFSNIDYPVSGLRIKTLYPSGFEFISSAPKAIEKTEWDIGVLSKAQGGKIEIFGEVFGDPNERKLLQADLGIWQNGEFILLKQIFQSIEIVEPSLFISQQINGSPEYIASPGSLLHYEIFFKNIGKDLLTDLFLVVKLRGQAYDFGTLRSNTGSFEPGDNSIIFDWRKVPKLKFLDAQEEGTVEFWIELKERWDIEKGQDRNLVVEDNVILSQARKDFETKVNTILEFAQKGYYQDEVFGNSGPIPPIPGESTTYTIMWQVGDYYNDIENIKAKAILPEKVELTGEIFPEDQKEKFAFDSVSREIVWDVGDLLFDESFNQSAAPNIAFQVAFTPDESFADSAAEIIGEAEITGEDVWTEQILSVKCSGIRADLSSTDTRAVEGQGDVQ